MNSNTRFFGTVLITLLILIVASGCGLQAASQAGELTSETHSVDLGPATSARVQIAMAMGELTINSGSSHLMEGTFDYNMPNWHPEVSYRVDGSEGELLVSQPEENSSLINKNGQNRWNLLLNESVPMNLEVYTGAGNSQLNLSAIDLTQLRIETGAGNGTFNLSGARSHDLSVIIKGGVGNITVILPQEMGVQVSVQSGIGKVEMPGFTKDGDVYINEAFKTASETVVLEIESGIGAVSLQLQ